MPFVEPRFDRVEIANTAAELRRNRNRLQDRLDRRAVDRLPGERTVEIDDVQIFEALPLERQRLRRRIVVEHGRSAHLAELQPDALAVLEVDGRKKDQSTQLVAPPLPSAREGGVRPAASLAHGGTPRGTRNRGHQFAIFGLLSSRAINRGSRAASSARSAFTHCGRLRERTSNAEIESWPSHSLSSRPQPSPAVP